MNKVIGLLLISVTLLLGGCASTPQNDELSLARTAIKEGQDQAALQHLIRAENEMRPSRQLRAELIFMRAGCFERLGRPNDAIGCYRYVIALYPMSQLAQQAEGKLKVLVPVTDTPATPPRAP